MMIKKIMGLWLACCIALLALMGSGFAGALESPIPAVIDGLTSDRVHLREQPSADAPSMGLYFTGTEALVMTPEEKGWVGVVIGSYAGYVKAEYVRLSTQPGTVKAKQPRGFVNITGAYANLRQAAALETQVLQQVKNGHALIILGETADHWYYVNTGDNKGYIKSSLVTLSHELTPGGTTDNAYLGGTYTWDPPAQGGNVGQKAGVPTIQWAIQPQTLQGDGAFQVDYDIIHHGYLTGQGDNYVELDLRLPRLSGPQGGIPPINAFFAGKEAFFYAQLPLEEAANDSLQGRIIRGAADNFYRLAHYGLTGIYGNVVSFAAVLDGGAGGVGFEGIEGNTFDLATGRRLTLSDILKGDGDIMEMLYGMITSAIHQEIQKSLGSGNPFFFQDAYAKEGQDAIRSFDPDDFYLTEEGLVLVYQKYALAAGASGPMHFTIPKEILGELWALPDP